MNSGQPDDLIWRQKERLRQTMRRQRENLTPAERAAAAVGLAGQMGPFLQRHFVRPETGRRLKVAVYAAMRGELDLSGCWNLLRQWPADLYFPAVTDMPDAAGRRRPALSFGRLPDGLSPEEFLRPGHFGVPEPPPASLTERAPDFDLVLVPGLAFDRQGNRLGWGKAYYDCFLSALPSSARRVGIGYRFQILDQPLPRAGHDQSLQAILTPEGLFDVLDAHPD